jgi:hypothetical protein
LQKRSKLEIDLDRQLGENNLLEGSVAEYRFHPTRKWQLDRAWPQHKVYVEVQGGIFVRGRHSRPRGQINDMEKISEATILGWRPILVCSVEIKNGQALDRIRRALLFSEYGKKKRGEGA